MMDVVRARANAEEEATSASTKTKELGRMMKQVDTAVKRADRSMRVVDLELALSEKTRLHQEELLQLRQASNVERVNLLVELQTACQYIFRMAVVAQQAGAAAPPFYGQTQIFVDANAINPQRLPLLQPT